MAATLGTPPPVIDPHTAAVLEHYRKRATEENISTFLGYKITDMTRDQLLGVIGQLVEEVERAREHVDSTARMHAMFDGVRKRYGWR